MTAKCVNPACEALFRYLRGGKLFLVDLPATGESAATASGTRFSEFFWLCEQCCQSMRIVVEKSGDVVLLDGSNRQVIQRRKPAVAASGSDEARLRWVEVV